MDHLHITKTFGAPTMCFYKATTQGENSKIHVTFLHLDTRFPPFILLLIVENDAHCVVVSPRKQHLVARPFSISTTIARSRIRYWPYRNDVALACQRDQNCNVRMTKSEVTAGGPLATRETMVPSNGSQNTRRNTARPRVLGLLLSSPFLLLRFFFLLSPLLSSFSLETTHHLLHPFIVRLVLCFLPLLHHPRKEPIVFPQLPHCPLLLLPILRSQLLSSRSFRVWVLRTEV